MYNPHQVIRSFTSLYKNKKHCLTSGRLSGVIERGEAIPSTGILNRIVKALEASPEVLINGTLQYKSANAIEDKELHIKFRKIEKLSSDKKKIVKEVIEALFLKLICKKN